MTKLTVPQKGTQRADSPLNNMIHSNRKEETKEKRRTSFSIDPDVYAQFRVYCFKQGQTVGNMLEKAMLRIMDDQ